MLFISKYINIHYAFNSAHVKFGVRIKAVAQPFFPAEPGLRTADAIRIQSAVSN